MKNKSLIIIGLIAALVVTAVIVAINRSDEPSSTPSLQEPTAETPDDTEINQESVTDEDQETNETLEEEVPASEVDDRGGYTPY